MNLLKNEKGTSIVEFAIILPLLIMLIFGMVDFASLLYNKAVITNASREGARAAIVYTTDANGNYSPFQLGYIQTVVNTYAANYLIGFPRSTHTTTLDAPNTNGCPTAPTLGGDDFVTVTVSYDYNWLLLHHFLPLRSPFPLISTTRVSCEYRNS